MRVRLLFFLVVLLGVSAGGTGPLAAPPARAAGHMPVLAYYYQWFDPSSWDRVKIDYPAAGRYSSDDQNVMRRHIQEAKAVGIEGFIVSWKDSPTNDRRLHVLMEVARSENFKLAMIYQGLDFSRKPLPVRRVAADMLTFQRDYAGDGVFKIFDRPLMLWSGTWAYSAADIEQVTRPVRSSLRVLATEKSVAGYQRVASSFDGNAYYWSSVNPDSNRSHVTKLADMGRAVHARGGLWIAPFAPGFDARLVGGSKTVDRKDGATLRAEYSAAVQSSPDALGLISWNEFSENTYVEPSQTYGDRYLKVLGELLKAPPVPASPLAQDSSGNGSGSGGLSTGPVALIVVALILLVAGGAAGIRRRSKASAKDRPADPPESLPPTPRRRRFWRRRRYQRLLAVTVLMLVAGGSAVIAVAAESGDEGVAAGTRFYGGPKPVRVDTDVVLGAAGDIACPKDARGLTEEKDRPNSCRMADTAALLQAMHPDAVLALGDNQYPNGSLARFQASYDQTWGAFKTITYPVPGNHEYGTPDAAGYFSYFGAAAGLPGAGYYSYDLGGWHIIALNSECDHVGGCGQGSTQETWLRQDLAAHPAACTLAYWHRPRFSSGTHGSNTDYDAFWNDLSAAGADVVLNGHDHGYERIGPVDAAGTPQADKGLTQFVVGTGGDSHYKFHDAVSGSQVRLAGRYGILQLHLRPGTFSWNFLTTDGGSADAGTGRCH
ncbi:MAG: hypothetical protein JWN35_2517 [Frankiales bacterium]|nr:hypothetical protein [Frankiales bacterium]